MRAARTQVAGSSDHMVEASARKWSAEVSGAAQRAQIWTDASAGPPGTEVVWSGVFSVRQRGQVIEGDLGRVKRRRNDLLSRLPQCAGMSRYRRMYVPGGTYFFTVNLAECGGSFFVWEIVTKHPF